MLGPHSSSWATAGAAWAHPPLHHSQQKRHVCLSLYFLGYHENGVVKAENGTSPRTKKLKSP